MIDIDYETLKSTIELIQTMLKLKKINPYRIKCTVNNIRIYPHTELFKYSLEKKIVSDIEDTFKKMYHDPFPYNIISKIMMKIQLPLFFTREFIYKNRLAKETFNKQQKFFA